MKPNRGNKSKDKRSSGCGLCKPHKHGGRARTDRDRARHRWALEEVRDAGRSEAGIAEEVDANACDAGLPCATCRRS